MVYVHCLSGSDKLYAEKLYENYLNDFVLGHGSPEECLALAKKYIANSDYKRAYQFLNKCTKENDAYAYYLLAICSERNNGHLDAVLELVKSAQLGYNVAQYELGYYLANKMCITNRAVIINPNDFVPEIAEYWLKLAAESKYIPAIVEYAKLLERNYNIESAIKFVANYEDLKDVDIYYTLGTLYSKNKDYENAYKYLNIAIDYGKCDANFDLGLLYLYGNSTEKDVSKAIKYFELSSYLVNSCMYLGNIYEKEEGFIDYTKAYDYYIKAKNSSKYPSKQIEIKITEFNNNKCPICGSYFSKITKNTLFGSKTICSKCKKQLK